MWKLYCYFAHRNKNPLSLTELRGSKVKGIALLHFHQHSAYHAAQAVGVCGRVVTLAGDEREVGVFLQVLKGKGCGFRAHKAFVANFEDVLVTI